VSDIPILANDDESHTLKRFMAQYDVPAYVRRERQVQEAFEELLQHCRRQREKWLVMVRLRLGCLQGLAGNWDRLLPFLAGPEATAVLRELESTLQPRLRAPLDRTSSARVLRKALRELVESIEHFNRRWLPYLQTVDPTEVNVLRERYNQFYLLEKECAFRSARLAGHGFRRLKPVTVETLAALLPPLPVPRLST